VQKPLPSLSSLGLQPAQGFEASTIDFEQKALLVIALRQLVRLKQLNASSREHRNKTGAHNSYVSKDDCYCDVMPPSLSLFYQNTRYHIPGAGIYIAKCRKKYFCFSSLYTRSPKLLPPSTREKSFYPH